MTKYHRNPTVRWIKENGLGTYLRVMYAMHVAPFFSDWFPKADEVEDDNCYLARTVIVRSETDWRRVAKNSVKMGFGETEQGMVERRVPIIIGGRRVHSYALIFLGLLVIALIGVLLALR